jgi:hypothetical protein
LIRARLRSRKISPRLAKAAKFFSAPLTSPGSTSGPYNWSPLDWGVSLISVRPSEFVQDPRTLILHGALVELLGPRMRLTTNITSGAEEWMDRRGFFVSETGGASRAPFEIQSEDTVERDSQAEEQRVEAAQHRIADKYAKATGRHRTDDRHGIEGVGDGVFMWFVKTKLFEGNGHAISIMKWLRVNSTVEYCNVLGASVYERPGKKGTFGLTELALVSSYLGGAPL